MKKIGTLAFFAILFSLPELFGAVLSTTNNEVYLAIEGIFGPNEPVRFDKNLVWCPFCITNPIELNYPEPPYGIKLRMTGPDGKEVARTTLGKSFGAKFDKVRRFEDAVHGWHVGCITAQGRYDARGGALSGPLLPAPKDLFQMNSTGIYTLEIQMQMFRVIKNTNQWTREMISFAPVKIKVERPPHGP